MHLFLIEVGTPYLVILCGVLVSVIGWLCNKTVKSGNDIVGLQVALKYYFDNAGKGAALLLNTPNPAPPHIRPLLDRYVKGKLEEEDKKTLFEWACSLAEDVKADREERGIAYQLVAAIGGIRRIPQKAVNG